MTKVIVTGGCGFIGSHLVDKLISLDYEVTIIDSFISGRFKSNINPAATLFDASLKDITNNPFHDYSVLFHMAAYPIRLNQLFDPNIYLEQTEGGTIAALEIARKNHINHFVIAASTSLYNHSKEVPTPESFIGPDSSFYGTSKFNSERWCEAYSSLFGTNLIICRFGRIFGPRSRNGSIWDLVHKLKNDPDHLTVLGNGTQTRSFLHVSDCVSGVLSSLAQHKDPVDRFNIANEDTATVKDIVDILLQESKLNPEVEYGSESIGWKGDNELVFPDSSKLRSVGWLPKLNSRETIRDCVRWTLKEAGML